MGKVLATFLGKSEESVAKTIERLEEKAGYPSHDVRFLAEISQRQRIKIKELGLDPDDTTGEELFYVLKSRFAQDCRRVDKSLGVDEAASIAQRVDKAIELSQHMLTESEVWSLKTSVAKKIINDNQPKKVMKLFRYRSVSSMLKRADLAELLMATRYLESPTWHKLFDAKLTHQTSANYELRHVRILNLTDDNWRQLVANKTVISDSTMGTVGVVSGNISTETPVLSIALSLLDEVEAVSSRSGRLPLGSINPTLSWWEGTEHLLAWNNGQPVSLNFKDIADAHIQNLDYRQRSGKHAAKAIWSQLMDRYKEHLADLPEELADLEPVKEIAKSLTPKELAFEYEGA